MAVIQMPDPQRDLASVLERNPGAITAQELARILGFGRTAIYEMAASGRIPHLRIGSSIRFDPYAVAQWLREHTVEAA